jgi:hypothetical protein
VLVDDRHELKSDAIIVHSEFGRRDPGLLMAAFAGYISAESDVGR